MQNHPNRVEDYTGIALFFAFGNLLWIFGVIWVVFGFVWVLFTGASLNHGITRLKERLQAREYDRRWPK